MKLRFTIRDLLWLTLLVALAIGWWIDRTNCINSGNERVKFEHIMSAQQQAQLREIMHRMQGNAPYGNQMPVVPSLYDSKNDGTAPLSAPQ